MRQGRIVVITGAAGGIGAALVERFVANGDQVVALDRTKAALDTLSGAYGEALMTYAGDIADEQYNADVAAEIQARHGRANILINSAGYFPTSRVEDMSLAEWRTVIDVNLTGTFLAIRAMLPLMKGRGWGRIINLGSATFFSGPPARAHYVAAKGGVIGLSRCLATEMGDEGITVNVVAPGLTVTDAVVQSTPPELIEAVRRIRPIKRDQQASDLTGAVFFLASPDADFITGQTLNVDGGLTRH